MLNSSQVCKAVQGKVAPSRVRPYWNQACTSSVQEMHSLLALPHTIRHPIPMQPEQAAKPIGGRA